MLSQAPPQTCCFLSPRDSLRIFSSLCQIFSEEDNYSQSRGLLLRVRPCSRHSWPSLPALPPHVSLFCHPQEVKAQPSLEPNSKKAPKSGSRDGVSAWWGVGLWRSKECVVGPV